MKITIDIPDNSAALIKTFIDGTSEDANTHGKLTIESLAEMLLEDVVLAVRRPGSWEGHNMIQVLTSHGYEI
jgi:hypothetical protein